MKRPMWLVFFLFPSFLLAQEDCDCSSELRFVIDYYEKNLPGYKDNVHSGTSREYGQLKRSLRTEAQNAGNKLDCFKLLVYYVEFFKDNHSGISMSFPDIDESNQKELQTFYRSDVFNSREMHALRNNDLKQYPLDDIRGTYQTADTTYTIAVIPSEGAFRKYIGVVVGSKTPLWKKGQVKMEINPKEEGGYEAFVYMRNHSLRYYPDFSLSDGILGGVWFKSSLEEKVNYSELNGINTIFKLLDDETAYLRIPTFSSSQSAKLDSFYKAVAPQIKGKEFLIIDVRGNGGGSDHNVSPLLDYIYTQPIQTDKVDIYVTEDNIKTWERWYEEAKADKVNFNEDRLKWFENEIKKMKKADLNTFIPRNKGKKFKHKAPKDGPKKVAVLYNRYCASSCETLLFWAKQSEKTILMGENSGGFVGYGEVGTIATPCYGFDLRCTMTRYENQRRYEVIGVAPDHKLNNEKDWVKQALEILKQ